jgi:hypothetical protein
MVKKTPLQDYADGPGSSQVNKPSVDGWAKLKDFRDPVSGRKLNSIGEPRAERFAKPSPAGTGLQKSSDSKA